MTWCLQKTRLLLGCPNLTIITDQRPLNKLLGDRALNNVTNPWLFHLKEQTLAGKEEHPGYLSTMPQEFPCRSLKLTSMKTSPVRKMPVNHPVYQLLLAKVLAGNRHQHKAQELPSLRLLYNERDRLAVAQDLVMYTFRQGFVCLVIEFLRPLVTANHHARH